MCGVCGCSDHSEHPTDGVEIRMNHHQGDSKLIKIEEDLLAKNNQYALANRRFFQRNGITALNVMSSPGSGKTTLIGKTISDLKDQLDLAVIVADQHTDQDAEFLRANGGRALQINTGRVCHLDAHTLGHSLETLKPNMQSILFIENIGNLVCPALFELGETDKVVILSVTEGDNKPLKYPDMFRHANLMILNKMDLLPYVDFNIQRCLDYVHSINSAIEVISVSSTKGEGLDTWYQWLLQHRVSKA